MGLGNSSRDLAELLVSRVQGVSLVGMDPDELRLTLKSGLKLT